VPSASSPPPGPTSGDIGEDSASITTTPPGGCADSYATTAISLSGTGKPQQSCSLPPSTFSADTVESIIPAGVEDVFDLEVERTENFIANGLVSHNTRWHEVDLAGHLLEKAAANPEADQWMTYSYEAIATKDEKHRKAGEALHPERYPLPELLRIKASIDPREWTALYQQNPVPPDGIAFKAEWMQFKAPPKTELNWYIGTDFAIGEKQTNDPTCLWPFAVDSNDDIYFDTMIHGRFSAMEIVEHLCDLMERYKPREVAIENVHISKTIGPYLNKRMQERRIYTTLREISPTKDKLARASTLRGRMQQRKVWFHPTTKTDVMSEFLAFPAGRHDDRVDAASTGMTMLDTMMRARPPDGPKPEAAPEWSMTWMKERIARSSGDTTAHVPRMLNGRPRKTKAAPTWTS
jgi:predicted phage terminase large subunit-like protein